MTNWTRYKRVSAPTEQILTLAQARAHVRVYHNDDDDILTRLIEVATAHIEGPNGIGIALCNQTWRLSMDDFPRNLMVGLGPVVSIDSIKLNDVTLATDSYSVDLDANPCRISHRYSYPSNWIGNWIGNGAVKITFTAGYGGSADVPADLKHAALLIIGHLYENREATIAGGTSMAVTEVPLGVSSILERYRA